MSYVTTYDAATGEYGKVWVEDEPTIEPDTRTLEDAQSEKLEELSAACASAINDGITLTTEDGVERKLSCRFADQINAIAALELVKNGAAGYLYKDSSGSCLYATANDIKAMTNGFIAHVTENRTYLSCLEGYVRSLTDPQEVANIQWGQELTGEWLVQYNEKMALASASIGGGMGG